MQKSLDQQDWSPVQGLMEPGQENKERVEEEAEGNEGKRGMAERRSGRMKGDIQGCDQALLHFQSGFRD